jgi:hypothetical protein
MQYLPKNEESFSAGKQSFEQNITPTVAYSARKITATLQQKTQSDSFFEEAFRRARGRRLIEDFLEE